jgi:hypothetical protein
LVTNTVLHLLFETKLFQLLRCAVRRSAHGRAGVGYARFRVADFRVGGVHEDRRNCYGWLSDRKTGAEQAEGSLTGSMGFATKDAGVAKLAEPGRRHECRDDINSLSFRSM